MFTISASRISVRFVALITVVSLILSAFPASFFVAFAQDNTPVAPVEAPTVEPIVDESADEVPADEETTEEPTVTVPPVDGEVVPPTDNESEEDSDGGFFGALRSMFTSEPTQSLVIVETPEVPRCNDNLLDNGSFEEPEVTNSEKWDKFAAVPPWTITKVSDSTPTTLELMRGWNGNAAAHGEQYAELDGEQSVKIAQTATTLVGGTYELSWAFAPRHNISADQNELGVSINGTEVTTNGPITGSSPLASGDWTRASETFVATGTTTLVEFADLGPSNTYGTFLDDVQLCLKREPPKPVEPEVCSITGEVVAMTANAVKFNGSPVDANRRTTGGLATVAPYSNFFGMDGNSWSTSDFLTLGVGGFVTYEFTDKVVVDQTGPDIAIWEITGGPTSQLSNAKAVVAVSQDGVTFTNVGNITGDGQVDISPAGLPFVRYVRVTDNSASIGNDDGGDGYDVDAITIIDGSCSDTAEIVAQKIVCQNEASLPNFGNGGPDITSSTAEDFVAANPTCALVQDWQFEWSNGHVANPGDALTGVAGGTWNTFGPTDVTGMTSVSILESELGNGKISLREVLKTNYIPFTYQNASNNSDAVTAEFYCSSDVVNYDNLEYLNVEADTTYHCVAWNVEKPKPASCELTIVSDTATVVEETNLTAVATYSSNPRWTANIPGATWIWETLQVVNPTVDTTRTFVETFTITNPTTASLTIAADNGYQVYLNNALVVDNITVENNYEAGTQDVIPLTLVSGANELKIVVKNFGLINSTFASNPAGARYKLTATGTDNCGRTTMVKTSGPVTMCKVSAAQQPLSGWTLTLLGNKVEDVVVPATSPVGVNTVNALAAGKSYVAKATGTWNNQGGANPADAEYSTTNGWTSWMDGYTGYSTDILELQINGAFDPASNWGAYNSAHTYARSFTPAATGSANFRIFDGESGIQNEGWFGDNSGTLSVSVYEGFAGITGQNGCVTFQNVPYGNYVVGEIMQDNWEYVSGAGEAVVSQANDEFVLVNRAIPNEPTYTETAETIVVNSNTASGENQPGWLFGRDLSTATPFAFSAGNAKIGSGSLAVAPIVNTTNSDKFIAEYFFLNTIDSLKSFTADFKLNASTSPAAANQFYLNVYANFGSSSPTKFYDCRYDVVATVASTSDYTTITFDPTLAYPVTTRGGASASPFTCPVIPADMDSLSSGSVIRAIAINIGDTSGSDTGVGGYLDNVVVKTENDTLLQKKTTTFDFEPVREVEEETYIVSGYKYECNLDGEYYCYDGYEGWLITATMGSTSTSTRTNEDGYYSFELPAGEWTISEETQEDWEQVYVEENGEEVDATVCELAVGLKKSTLIERIADAVWEPSYTCDFGNYYDEDNGNGDYTDTISGFKWNDLDGNGVRNGEEPTLPNWVIGLYDGEDLIATTSTNGAGVYFFENLKSGEYTVAEVQQSGWTQTGTLRNGQEIESSTCNFEIGYWDERARGANFENDDVPYKGNTCDFGNRQNQVIDEPDDNNSSSRSSGTRTRGPEGQVLGATTQCGLWLEDYMQQATENDSYQVLKLQVFLNLQGFTTPLTAIFDAATESNVKLFQTKYFDEIIKPWFERGIVPHNRPTGFVYKTTRWKINDIMCPGIEPYPSFEGENLQTNVLLSQ